MHHGLHKSHTMLRDLFILNIERLEPRTIGFLCRYVLALRWHPRLSYVCLSKVHSTVGNYTIVTMGRVGRGWGRSDEKQRTHSS